MVSAAWQCGGGGTYDDGRRSVVICSTINYVVCSSRSRSSNSNSGESSLLGRLKALVYIQEDVGTPPRAVQPTTTTELQLTSESTLGGNLFMGKQLDLVGESKLDI